MGVTSGAEFPSGAPGLVSMFSGGHVAQSLVFCMVLYRLLTHICFYFSKKDMDVNEHDRLSNLTLSTY